MKQDLMKLNIFLSSKKHHQSTEEAAYRIENIFTDDIKELVAIIYKNAKYQENNNTLKYKGMKIYWVPKYMKHCGRETSS